MLKLVCLVHFQDIYIHTICFLDLAKDHLISQSAAAGSCRIRSRTQGIALSLGDRITIVQRGVQVSKEWVLAAEPNLAGLSKAWAWAGWMDQSWKRLTKIQSQIYINLRDPEEDLPDLNLANFGFHLRFGECTTQTFRCLAIWLVLTTSQNSRFPGSEHFAHDLIRHFHQHDWQTLNHCFFSCWSCRSFDAHQLLIPRLRPVRQRQGENAWSATGWSAHQPCRFRNICQCYWWSKPYTKQLYNTILLVVESECSFRPPWMNVAHCNPALIGFSRTVVAHPSFRPVVQRLHRCK